MRLPLYRRDNDEDTVPQFGDNSHAGLYWNKFFDQWGYDFKSIKENDGCGKRAWIQKFEGARGHQTQLTNDHGRQKELVKKLAGHCAPYILQSSFVIGMGYEHPVENGMAWHPTLGVPYLPASSVKGLVRAWAQDWAQDWQSDPDQADITRIFGDSDRGAGSIIFFDALPIEPVQMMAEIMTPHDGGWRIKDDDTTPSDWVSPTPIPFLAVETGAKFCFAIAPRCKNDSKEGKSDIDLVKGWLTQALDWLGAGAKTSLGFGRFITPCQQKKNQDQMAAEQKKEALEEAQREEEERLQPGRKAYYRGQLYQIASRDGEKANILFIDTLDEDRMDEGEGGDETVSVSELNPV